MTNVHECRHDSVGARLRRYWALEWCRIRAAQHGGRSRPGDDRTSPESVLGQVPHRSPSSVKAAAAGSSRV
jgi:hypothetical protein